MNLEPVTCNLKPNLGFSLVEMLIVVTLTVMIIVAATSVLLTTLLGGGKVNTIRTIKENGDYSMGQMTTLLRNSAKLLPNDFGQVCDAGMEQLRFQSYDEGITTLQKEDVTGAPSRIASNSAIYLTSDAVNVSSPLLFDCFRSSDGTVTTINISFTLDKGDSNSSRVTEYGSQNFSQNVTIRSF